MADSQQWERHWNTVSLGIVAVASAAATLFTADLAEIATSYAAFGLIVIAMLAYLIVLYFGALAIFSASSDTVQQTKSKREITQTLYSWVAIEIFAIAALLISQAFFGLLQSPAVGS